MKKTMKLFVVVLLGIFLLLAGGVVAALAATATIMDEYGPGYYRDLGNPTDPWHVWNGVLRPDPTWPGHNSLVYIGTRGPFSGYFDVLAKDPTGADSDMLRFWNSATDTRYTWVIFYSAGDIGGAIPADYNGLPPIRNVQFTVNEGADGIFNWTSPLTGNEFKAYSEGHASIPEPATMLLLGLGLIGLAGVRREFKQ